MEYKYMVGISFEKNFIEVPFATEIFNAYMQSEITELMDEYEIELATAYLVPKSIQKEFEQFEKKVLEDLSKSSKKHEIMEEWLFMNEETLDGFMHRFKVYEREFIQLRDKILSQLDGIKEQFISSLLEFSSKKEDRKLYCIQLEKVVPTKEVLKKAFKIELQKLRFTQKELDGFTLIDNKREYQKLTF